MFSVSRFLFSNLYLHYNTNNSFNNNNSTTATTTRNRNNKGTASTKKKKKEPENSPMHLATYRSFKVSTAVAMDHCSPHKPSGFVCA